MVRRPTGWGSVIFHRSDYLIAVCADAGCQNENDHHGVGTGEETEDLVSL